MKSAQGRALRNATDCPEPAGVYYITSIYDCRPTVDHAVAGGRWYICAGQTLRSAYTLTGWQHFLREMTSLPPS